MSLTGLPMIDPADAPPPPHIPARKAIPLLARMYARELAHRIAARRSMIVSLAYTVTGMLGALAGAWVIGWWCLGLVAIFESVGLLAVGLLRDDGSHLPRLGARTVDQVLDDERLRT